MSAGLRSTLGPIRTRLVAELDTPPDLRVDFESAEERTAQVRVLRAYRDRLSRKQTRFYDLHDRLLSNHQDEAAVQVMATDADILARYDEVIADVNAAINDIEEQIADERREQERERADELRNAQLAGRREIQNELAASQARNVKLPKLELPRFGGDVLKWREFWDVFESSIHRNQSLGSVDKLHYLKGQLVGEAKKAVAGLASTNENYNVAISLLKERFGKSQTIIDSHYLALTNLTPVTNNNLAKLRALFDSIELHMNSLEALGEDADHRQFVSMIRSKLPPDVVFRLEESQDGEPWTVSRLRERLRKYLTSRELAEGPTGSAESSTSSKPKDDGAQRNGHHMRRMTSSALLSGPRAQTKRANQACVFCNGEHWSDKCKAYPTMQARKDKIKGLCFGCFSPDHGIRNCDRVKACYYCKKQANHHSSLCPKKFGKPTGEAVNVAAESGKSNSVAFSQSEGSLLSSSEAVLFQTATVHVESMYNSQPAATRLLLDSGSHRTYISERLAKQLQLKPVGKDKLTVFTFGSTSAREVETTVVKLKLKLLDGSYLTLSANVVPVITGNLHRSPIDFNKIGVLYKDLRLADTIPTKLEEFTVDLLIGIDFYWDIVTSERIELSQGLYFIGSKIGWILTGRYSTEEKTKSPISSLFIGNAVASESSLLSLVPMDDQAVSKIDVKMFWELETIGIRDCKNDQADELVLEQFNKSIKFEDGRYQVQLPWKEDANELPDNYQMALGRLNSLVKRGIQNPPLLEAYNNIIECQLDNGIIEKVEGRCGPGKKEHYIAHHPIVTPHKTTKVRIVFDGSAKSKASNLSVNERLHRGPILMKDLCAILLRFRLHKFAILADIEKAFHQVGLQEQDRDVTRFIWLRNPKLPTTQNNLQVYRFTRVPFGLISSPFLLNATIDYHLRKNGGEVAMKILRDIYVDNIVTGAPSINDAIALYEKTKELFGSASMNVRQWMSNSSKLLDHIPHLDQATGTQHVLGVPWDPQRDSLSVSCPSAFESALITKRTILKFVASFFDPMGLASPVLLRPKLFLQKLWELNVDWDQQLSTELCNEWESVLIENSACPTFHVPRFVGTASSDAVIELHGFCDASQKAYGTCIYIRIVTAAGASSHLIFSKARLAPVRGGMTIPRLELMAVHMGTRCLNFVTENLCSTISRRIIWSDSQCVLHWINSTKPLTTFVRNRINELKSTQGVVFRFVPTGDNPADLASRGASSASLVSSDLWWKGPQWLSSPTESKWPAQTIRTAPGEEVRMLIDQEVAKVAPVCVAPEGPLKGETIIDSTKYSSLSRLLRVTALCLRFIGRLRKKPEFQNDHVTSTEIANAKDTWTKWIQEKHYSDAISAVRGNKKNHLVESLGLWIDDQGLLRCGGRLRNSNLPQLSVYPKLLPKNDWFTNLLIMDTHLKLFHAGVAHTLAQIRNEYWIPSGRAKVFSVMRTCKPCVKFDGGPYKSPKIPVLPHCRVTESAPFTYSGLDYFGPLYVKTNPGTKKVWVALFTCMSTRAIHLEVVEDMSASHFLMALKRFIARRGTPNYILSDNAGQFKLAKSVIAQLWRNVKTDEHAWSYISSRGINWAFIAERAPWKGGFYERLIRLVKQGLRKSIQGICLTIAQLHTIITEIEAVVNSRPLTYVGSDLRDGSVLTPSHFLSLNRSTGTPIFTHDPTTFHHELGKMGTRRALLTAWKKGQKHLKTFWRIWREQYLLSLRERDRRLELRSPRIVSKSNPKVGDVVHLKHDLPRGTWQLAKVVELCPSSDGKVRSARVQIPSGNILTRAVMHLYPLECPVDEPEGELDDDADETGSVEF